MLLFQNRMHMQRVTLLVLLSSSAADNISLCKQPSLHYPFSLYNGSLKGQ